MISCDYFLLLFDSAIDRSSQDEWEGKGGEEN